MEEKTYTISGKDLDALVKAAEIIQAFLVKHYGDKRMQEFDAEAVLKSLAQPEPETKVPHHCHCLKGKTASVATTCACDTHTHRVTKKAAKTPTMHQLADELGVDYKTVKNYAYKNDLGIVRRGPSGNVTRELFPADVDAIREHFGK